MQSLTQASGTGTDEPLRARWLELAPSSSSEPAVCEGRRSVVVSLMIERLVRLCLMAHRTLVDCARVAL
jgi:hypothetical protein